MSNEEPADEPHAPELEADDRSEEPSGEMEIEDLREEPFDEIAWVGIRLVRVISED